MNPDNLDAINDHVFRVLREVREAAEKDKLAVLKRSVSEAPADLRPSVSRWALEAINHEALAPHRVSSTAERLSAYIIMGVSFAVAAGAALLLPFRSAGALEAWEVRIATASTIVLAGFLLSGAVLREMTRDQRRLYAVGIAIAAAGLVAVIPGFFEIELALWGSAVRAGGALGVFGFLCWWIPRGHQD